MLTCIVHLIRYLLEFVSRKVAKPLCRRSAPSAGARTLSRHEGSGRLRGRRYPAITQSWRRGRQQVVPFFPIRVCTASSTRRIRLSKCPRRVGAISNSA
ncbi:hypothetical protein EB230_31140 [Mesorhizobium sp. NZP2234]|nr:hypothetical protein EB230_31140 [Mesorhizobium sp. NZP2234]